MPWGEPSGPSAVVSALTTAATGTNTGTVKLAVTTDTLAIDELPGAVVSLAEIEVACPACGQTVLVEIVARDIDDTDGPLHVELSPLWSHECPPQGDGERRVA